MDKCDKKLQNYERSLDEMWNKQIAVYYAFLRTLNRSRDLVGGYNEVDIQDQVTQLLSEMVRMARIITGVDLNGTRIFEEGYVDDTSDDIHKSISGGTEVQSTSYNHIAFHGTHEQR